jgi:RimJ/RimL family protein N-acetyltransferase
VLRAGRPSPGSTSGLRTERLLLRPWRAADHAPFAELNADPAVMEYFPSTLTRPESDALAERIALDIQWRGYGLWAVELPDETPFIGFVGLSATEADMPFAQTIEVGWRLARAYWGRGLASEAARAALAYGFDELELDEIVALTAVGNVRSRRVMERLGMHCDPADDFTHPDLPAEHPLAAHVLYRLAAHARE